MAANQLSPGVVLQERDLTTITNFSTSNIGVIAAPFTSGPVEEIVQIANERELAAVFGEPNDDNYEYWFTASQYLDYGGILKTIRVDNSALKNAVNTGTAVKIKNLQDYEENYQESNNTWTFAARTAGSLGNSIGIFMTDAGADQIAVVPAPDSGNEFEFVEDEAVSTDSGAAGKVFKYSIVLEVEDVVGTFTPSGTGVTTCTINIGGSEETVTILAWNKADKKLEIALPSGGVTGIIADGQTITQGDNTADIKASGIERRLYIALNKDSISFAATDSVDDTGSNAVAITSVREEYAEREYLPGVKWINSAPRPGTSRYAKDKGGHRDEVNIVVIDVDGEITGTAGQVLERFVQASKASDAKTTVGETNYYVELIKQRSEYIYWGEHETGTFAATATASAGDWGQTAADRQFNLLRSDAGSVDHPNGDVTVGSKNNATYYYRLASGADYASSGSSYTITNTDLSTAYELVEDSESEDINFILAGPSGADDSAALAKITSLVNIVEERRDCLLFVSPRRGNIVGLSNKTTITDNIVNFMNLLPSSSYMVLDSGYKYIYDKYNDVYRYVPCNGDIAGICLQTTETAESWFSPAGLQRGILRNAIKLAFSPNKTQRDRLYAARVNPVVSFPGQGVVLYGDKTALGTPSAFDRINVRRLFLALERVIGDAAKAQLFEQNDDAQRQLFVNIVEPFLRDVQGRRGIVDFLVKCDDDNNPEDAVDRGEFFAEIYVQPTRTINFITLTFVATRTGVSFSEVAN